MSRQSSLQEMGRDTGWVTKNPRRKPLMEGRGVLRVQDVAQRLGVRAEDLAALIERGQLSGGLTLEEDGPAWGIFEDDVPSREQVLELGARPIDESTPDPYVEPDPPAPSASWQFRW
jgi:hypothetical protein